MSGDEQYYIRVRGRTLGPFDIEKLKQLHTRGQFGRSHEVSTNRQTWMSGGNLLAVFSEPERASANVSTAQSEPEGYTVQSDEGNIQPTNTITPPVPNPPSEDQWYFSSQGEVQGPMSLVVLQARIFRGQLSEHDLIWSPGFQDWTPLEKVPELRTKELTASGPATTNIRTSTDAFCFACGTAIDSRAEVCPQCGVRQPSVVVKSVKKKDRVTAAILALVLGGLGVHHFYLGNVLVGIVYLIFCLTFVPAIIAFVEFIVFLCMSNESFDAKYNRPK